MKRIGLAGLLVCALLVMGATTRTPTQVEVTNLPTDASGNLRVSEQGAGGGNNASIEMTFRQTDLVPSPPGAPSGGAIIIPIPAGFTRASVTAIQSLDFTKAHVDSFCTGFGPASSPIAHGSPGDDQPLAFPMAGPIGANLPGCVNLILNGALAEYFVAGPRMLIAINASGPLPPDSEYYLHVFLAR